MTQGTVKMLQTVLQMTSAVGTEELAVKQSVPSGTSGNIGA